jgi:hypothetical protein
MNDQQFLAMQRRALLGRFDAGETPFLERELTQVRARVYTVQYPFPMGRQFAPKATDIAPSANSYVYKVYDPKGMAKFVAYKANDIPRVDLTAKEVLGLVRTVACAYAWDVNELKEAARVGIGLPEMKARAAADFIERAIDAVLAFGSLPDETGALPDVGLTGLANNTAVSGLGIIPLTYWPGGATTADNIMKELNLLTSTVGTFSENIWNVNTLLLPTAHYAYIEQATFSSLTGETILTVFKRNHPTITMVAPWSKLKTAGAGGVPRAIAYQRDPMVLEAIIPQEMEILPPEMQGFEVIYNCHARVGGTKIYQPLAMRYGDFATS